MEAPAATRLHDPVDDREDAPEGTPAKSSVVAPPGPPAGSGSAAGRATGWTPASSQERLTAPPRDDFGPAGQTVWPWIPAQGGLDGRAYAIPAPPAPPEPQASPQLGLSHGVSLQSPQLELFDRVEAQRHLFRGTLFDRQAKCHWVRRVKASSVAYSMNDRGRWSISNLVTCGHWTCPACGPRRAKTVAATVGAMMRRWFDVGDGSDFRDDFHDVWMLTLTVPHYRTETVEVVVADLYAAAATFFRSRTWLDFEERFGIVARVRVLDVTFGGENGTHPHFHIALFVEEAYSGFRHRSRLERETKLARMVPELGLVEAWKHAVAKTGREIRNERNFEDVSVRLTPSERASSYFTKWGLADEVAKTTSKRDNHLAVLDGVGDVGAHWKDRQKNARALFAWRLAVDGRQWVSGLEDARRRIGVDDDDVDDYLAELRRKRDAEEPPELVTPISFEVREFLYSRAQTVGHAAVIAEAKRAAAAGEPVQLAMDAFLWSIKPRGNVDERGPPDG